jgi:hypothetical protein
MKDLDACEATRYRNLIHDRCDDIESRLRVLRWLRWVRIVLAVLSAVSALLFAGLFIRKRAESRGIPS